MARASISVLGKVAGVILATFSALCVAADPWDSCAVGTDQLVRISSCSSTWTAFPGECPSGEEMRLSELQALVSSIFPSGGTCRTTSPPYTWSSSVETNSQSGSASITVYKNCLKPDGTTSGTGSIAGSKICGSLDCPLEVGSYYPLGDMQCVAGDCSAGSQVCFQGCQIEVEGFGLTVGGSSQQSALSGLVVSDTCSAPNAASGISEDDENCEVINGVEWCDVPGSYYPCKKVDGALICYSYLITDSQLCAGDGACATPQNPVVTLGNGGQIAVSGTPSPPAPNNGNAGNPAPPDSTFTATGASGGSTGWNYWTPGTVAQSTTGSDSGGDDDPVDNGLKCGGDGEAPCSVSIDESGTPENMDAELQPSFDLIESGYDDHEQYLLDQMNQNPAEGWALPSFGLPIDDCQTINVQFGVGFFQVDKDFPTPGLCDFIDNTFKRWEAYALWCFVAFALVSRALASPGGGSK